MSVQVHEERQIIRRPNRWNLGRRALFRKRWLEGASFKAISHETGMSWNSCIKERKRQKLPTRNKKGIRKTKHLVVYFDDAMWRQMQSAAFGRSANMSEYIRALIRRDTGG